jgi:hypothetical protein
MREFLHRFNDNQKRALLILLGMIGIIGGGAMMYWHYFGASQIYFNVGGAIVTVGCIVIGLELAGLRRVLRMGFGFVLLAVGLFLSVPGVPGPGFVFLFLALAILSLDFKWARDLTHKMNVAYHRAVNRMKGRRSEPSASEKHDAEKPPQP